MKTITEYIQKKHIENNGPFWAVICGKDYEEISDWVGPYESEEECLKDLDYADINTEQLSVEDDDFFVQIAILPEDKLIKHLKNAHLYQAPLKSNCEINQFASRWLNTIEFS